MNLIQRYIAEQKGEPVPPVASRPESLLQRYAAEQNGSAGHRLSQKAIEVAYPISTDRLYAAVIQAIAERGYAIINTTPVTVTFQVKQSAMNSSPLGYAVRNVTGLRNHVTATILPTDEGSKLIVGRLETHVYHDGLGSSERKFLKQISAIVDC
jgi:hypothetical protein